MSNENGRNRWLLWMAGIIMGLIATAFTFIGNGIIANDRLSRDRDEKLGEKIDTVQLRTTRELSTIKEQQATMLTHLEYLRYGRTNP